MDVNFFAVGATDQRGGKRRTDYALCRASRSRAHSLVGNPVAIVGDWEIPLANLASRFGRRSNTMTDDSVDRLAGVGEIRLDARPVSAKKNETPPYIRACVPHFTESASDVIPRPKPK
jgi:hypothetical protein